MEDVKCNYCDSSNVKILLSKKDKFAISECEFNLVQCQNCRLVYTHPRPTKEEIADFYPETYSWKETLVAGSKITGFIRKLEKAYRYHLLRYETAKLVKMAKSNTGKLLDVGCGSGDRLDILRKVGFDTYGVEISQAAEYAKQHLGLNVKQGDLFDADYPDSFFDIVTLYNVLEHTHDPRKVIKELKRILKDNGILIIQVPNIDCVQFKIFKKRWAAIDVPRDLYYFSDSILKCFLEKEEFIVNKVDHSNNFWHPPTLVISSCPVLDPQLSWIQEASKANSYLRRLCWGMLTLVVSPLAKLESLIGRSALVTIYTVKSNRPEPHRDEKDNRFSLTRLTGFQNIQIEVAAKIRKYPFFYNYARKYYSSYLLRRRGILSCVIFTTNRCNQYCRHCKIWKKDDVDLPVKTVKTLVQDPLLRNSLFVLTGGEFELHPQHENILEVMKDKKFILATNGYNSDQLIELVRKHKIKLLQVSLDGRKETHDTIRGKVGAFDNVMKLIQELHKETNISISYTVMEQNSVEDLSYVKGICDKYKLSLGLGFLYSPDYYDVEHPVTANCDVTSVVDDAYTAGYNKWADGDLQIQCNSVKILSFIFPEGNVSLCATKNDLVLGNLHESTFSQIWNSPRTIRLQNDHRSCNACYAACHRNFDLRFINRDKIKRLFHVFIKRFLISLRLFEIASMVKNKTYHLFRKSYNPKEFWEIMGDRLLEEKYQRQIHEDHFWLLEKIKELKPRKILEVGCGFGRNLRFLLDNFNLSIELTGVDIVEKMIDHAHAYVGEESNLELKVADIRNLPFQDNEFDLVFTHGTLMHIPENDIKLSLQELARVSRKDVICIEETFIKKNHPKDKVYKPNKYTFVYGYTKIIKDMGFKLIEKKVSRDIWKSIWFHFQK